MADNTNIIPEHPEMCTCAACPGGMTYYKLHNLSPFQQFKINQQLLQGIKTNGQYLADNPQIRAIVALLVRHLLTTRPRNVHQAAKEFFESKSKIDLINEVDEYIQQKKLQTANYDQEEVEDEEEEEIEDESSFGVLEDLMNLIETPQDVAHYIIELLLDFEEPAEHHESLPFDLLEILTGDNKSIHSEIGENVYDFGSQGGESATEENVSEEIISETNQPEVSVPDLEPEVSEIAVPEPEPEPKLESELELEPQAELESKPEPEIEEEKTEEN